jgi:hypothetical protein
MDMDPLTELATLRSVLEAADLPQDCRESALWCVGQLPELYRELARTYDSRHGDEILRLARGLMLKVGSHPVAGAVRVQLLGLHERLGFGELDLKPPRRPRKAG